MKPMTRFTVAVLLVHAFVTGGAAMWESIAQPKPTTFTSQYTDLKTGCRAAITLKKGEPVQGDDMPLKCRGLGGYDIRIDYSAASSSLRLQRGDDSSGAISLGMQPIDYDRKHKIEWRLANGIPFAVIFRVDKSKSEQPEEMWRPENKSGESLLIKGLKGYDQIDFEVDAKTANANVQAREMADAAYAKKN